MKTVICKKCFKQTNKIYSYCPYCGNKFEKEDTRGKRIRHLREMQKETQAELGKALNVNRVTINQWENETRHIKTHHIVALAEHFNTTCDYILIGVIK